MRPRQHLAAALAGALGFAAGCESMGGLPATSTELSSAQFDDVPAPRGFTIDLSAGRSWSYSEGGGAPSAIRMGRLEYVGLGDPGEVLRWFGAEMPRPMHGWSAGEAPEGAGEALLFRRGGEACLVSVRQEGSALRLVVERNTGGAVGRD